MCTDCGCGLPTHHHPANPLAPHGHSDAPPLRILNMRKWLLDGNHRSADQLRARYRTLALGCVRLISSPGSGKTELLARSAQHLGDRLPMAAVVGDLATDLDAARMRPFMRGPVTQIATGRACHLDAAEVGRVVDGMDLRGIRLLAIEDVGNLVCPAEFDLGEDARVVLVSTTEGEDKPLKYLPTFATAHVVLITKIDLAAATGCDLERLETNVRSAAPQARILRVSSRSGEGLAEWTDFLTTLSRPVPV